MKGAGSKPVKLCGPVDCKGIYGSDGRYYMLDLVRITPKDCNFDPTAKEFIRANGDQHELLKEDSIFFEAKLANGPDSTNASDSRKPRRMYLLRPELVQIYNIRRQEEAKSKAIQEYKEKKIREKDASDGTAEKGVKIAEGQNNSRKDDLTETKEKRNN